ncbi:hypothetical protein NP822_001859 [Escherichia coli]|nr:hypothetical protein [Escherichia coli]EJN4350201.1 hypothetical protein [Escherichia coli]EJN4399559.1 hypothetical protein [Escherichia coli]
MTSPFIQQIADNRVCQVLTCLPEKFVVDFANGIDVAQEHIRTAGERTFFRRLKEGLPDHLIVGGNQVFSFAEHGLL